MTEKVAAIVGATGVGKTDVSLQVAALLDAEIVSIDSMQSYRGMDIGTDKAAPEARAQIGHHLIDIKDPTEELTVAEFQQQARAAISEITARGRLPLLVGGSGLYFRAVVDDLEFPPRSAEVRARLESEGDLGGAEALHARLANLDPIAASRIEPSNARRTIRALEVIELTGRPFSENDAWSRYESVYELAVAGLSRPRDDLDERIEARVRKMLEAGLVTEVRALAERGMGPTARQALGYRQVLEAGAGSTDDFLIEEIGRATRRFARRQESWFRADPRVEWFDASDPGLPQRLAGSFRSALRLP